MASPFRVFRKNQKTMIAALAILAMFAFIVLPSMLKGRGGGGPAGRPNRVMIEWDYGEIRESELYRRVQARRILQAFLNEAAQLGVYASREMPKAVPVIDAHTNVNEQDTVQTLVLAKAAEERGFVISDAAINLYLKKLTNNSVNAAQLQGIIARRQLDNRRLTMNMVFEVLRTELLSQQLLSSYITAAQSITPAERWEAWKRWNDFVTIETLPVPVEKFLDQVEAPTDNDLRTLFDQYKNRIKQPDFIGGKMLDSPEPGFRVPPKVALNYLKADYDDFVSRVAEEITNEEIAKYYEDNKDRLFVRATLFEEPEPREKTDGASATQQDDAQQNSESDEAGDGQQGGASQDSPNAEGNGEKPVTTPATPAEKTQDGKGTGEQQPPSPDDGAQQSIQQHRNRMILASYQEQSEGTQDKANSDRGPDAASNGQAKPSAVDTSAADESPEAGADNHPSAGGEQEQQAEKQKAEEPQYSPLEEVQDEIRSTLAGQRAAEKMENVLKSLEPMLRDYSEQLSAWKVTKADPAVSENAPPPPQPPDMKSIAQQHGLVFGKTVLRSFYELNETELGKSVGVLDGKSLSNKVFGGTPTNYRPLMTKDIDGNHSFLAWVVESTPLVDVKLEDVRPEVERAWKMQKARTLAREEAKRLADQAIKSGQTLAGLFPAAAGYQVTESDPFSWLTIGATPQERNVRLRLSEVAGVDGAGPNFMQAVFNLKVGDVGVAMNHAQTVAYVVRVVSHRNTLRQLQDSFLLTSTPAVNQVRQINLQNILLSLMRELVVSTHLRWVHPPDRPRNEER